MCIEECAFCFKNPTSDDWKKVKIVRNGFPMKITKRPNECKDCAVRRSTQNFDKHNYMRAIASVSVGGVTVNWASYISILRKGEPERKRGATRALLDLGMLTVLKSRAYGISVNNKIIWPAEHATVMLYFPRKSDAAEFAGIALAGGNNYEIVPADKGAA